MFKRIWNVLSVSVGLWSIYNTLKKADESKHEVLEEFYKTLTPEEQKYFKDLFKNVGLPKIETFSFPEVNVPAKVAAPTQVEILKAGV